MAEPSGAGDSIPLECPGLDTAAGEEFLQEVFQILLEEGVRKSTDVTQKVCDWKELQELWDLLDLELRSDGEGRERLLQRCRDVLRFSVRTGALPRFDYVGLQKGLLPIPKAAEDTTAQKGHPLSRIPAGCYQWRRSVEQMGHSTGLG
ncbi:cysteine sulfinic acid decarboxylase-like [Ammospiza nelsoni]|uniref:cysteine sulfinic acid decarboxylase-like n=1 Tax=Ammospiza nelsoni TaxID=2857394 RepID=UPI00286B4517|nr:cysteine sulfinic acid decarboxylase-like [Ammospiza nelsoni]